MSRPKKTSRRRLNIETSEEVREALEELKRTTQADSLSEVIRRALAVYEFLWAEKRQGAKIVLRGEDGDKELVLL